MTATTGGQASNERRPECLSELALDRLRLGDLAGRDAGVQATRHLDGCPRCAARLGAQRDERPPEIDLAAVVVRASAARVSSEPRSAERRRFLPRAIGTAVAVALVVAVVLVSRPQPGDDASASRGPGIKGSGWLLEVVARYPDGAIRRIDDGTLLRSGTSLRFEVAAEIDGYMAIFSLDTAGRASPLFPEAGPALPISGGGQRIWMDGAVVLDGTPGVERISYVHCRRAFDVEMLMQAARRAFAAADGRLEHVTGLVLDCREQVFWLRRPGGGQ